ncbi:MAG: hypothetical protein FWD33_04180 [Alphaproteobacteria bacterium]|nr:hypothetical protein [Alphaproteobacteria bacterium]
MKKNLIILAAFATIPVAAFAEKKIWRASDHLTAEQQACVAQHNCPKAKFQKDDDEAAKAAMKAARACTKAAFESCGVEMPDMMKEGKGCKKSNMPN